MRDCKCCQPHMRTKHAVPCRHDHRYMLCDIQAVTCDSCGCHGPCADPSMCPSSRCMCVWSDRYGHIRCVKHMSMRLRLSQRFSSVQDGSIEPTAKNKTRQHVAETCTCTTTGDTSMHTADRLCRLNASQHHNSMHTGTLWRHRVDCAHNQRVFVIQNSNGRMQRVFVI